VMVIVGFHAKLVPSDGEVMVAVGGLFAATTVTVDGELVLVYPRSSVAQAVSVYVPAPRRSRRSCTGPSCPRRASSRR
jgi:hypothetical protein